MPELIDKLRAYVPKSKYFTLVAEAADEIERLRSELEFLDCLRSAGVDNWSGYDEALDYMETIKRG